MINKMELNNKAILLRRRLGEDAASPIDIFSIVQSIQKLTLIFYPLEKNISGACFKNKSSSIILINTDMSIGRQRFSLAHELYHLYFDNTMSSTICSSQIDKGNINEKKADLFASYFLMPSVALYERLQKGKEKLTIDDVIQLEQYYGVSHQAMLIRLQDEKKISSSEIALMQTGVIVKALKLGLDDSLYKPTSEKEKIRVLGYYIVQAEKLLQKNIISNGKYEEFLLDAFRDDIVFDEGLEDDDVVD